MPEYSEKQKALEDRIGYEFSNKDLLVEALTHPSYGDGRKGIIHYERLEFLGDRILNFLTAELLFQEARLKEGDMARKLNSLVRKECCACVATSIELGAALFMSDAEERNDGRNKISILGDSCEALFAAIYLDGGEQAVRKFYKENWVIHYDKAMESSQKDPKTALQELSVMRGFGTPQYKICLLYTSPSPRDA